MVIVCPYLITLVMRKLPFYHIKAISCLIENGGRRGTKKMGMKINGAFPIKPEPLQCTILSGWRCRITWLPQIKKQQLIAFGKAA
ncbi:Uncharacterised protein [Plesiomonas shigelloides]|nr:Uncharacterised protein [Plesiomonas shigelloides]